MSTETGYGPSAICPRVCISSDQRCHVGGGFLPSFGREEKLRLDSGQVGHVGLGPGEELRNLWGP